MEVVRSWKVSRSRESDRMSMSCGVGMILTDPKKDFFEVGDISPDGPAGRSGLIQKGDILKGIDKVQVGSLAPLACRS